MIDEVGLLPGEAAIRLRLAARRVLGVDVDAEVPARLAARIGLAGRVRLPVGLLQGVGSERWHHL